MEGALTAGDARITVGLVHLAVCVLSAYLHTATECNDNDFVWN